MSSSADVADRSVRAERRADSDFVSESALAAMWRHRWMVIAVVLVGVVIGAVVSRHQVPVYVSESRLLFDGDSKPIASEPAENQNASSDAYLQSQADLLVSTPVMTAAAEALEPMHLRSLAQAPDAPSDAAQTLQSHLETNVDAAEATITVAYAAPVARDSAMIVNTVVESYRKYEAQHRQDAVAAQLKQLQLEKENLDSEVAVDTSHVQRFKMANPDVAIAVAGSEPGSDLGGDAGAIASRKLAMLNEQLLDAQASYSNVTEKYEALAAQLGPQPQPADAGRGVTDYAGDNARDNAGVDLAYVQGELNRASAKVDQLIAKGLPPTDPDLQDARAYLARMYDKLIAVRQNAAYAQLDALKQEQTLAQHHLMQAQAAMDAEKQAAAQLQSKGMDLSALQEQLQRSRHSRDALAAKIDQILVTQDAPLEMRVLEKARPAGDGWSGRMRTVSLGAAGGLLAGMAISLVLHLKYDRLRTPEQVASVTGLQVLGMIPRQSGGGAHGGAGGGPGGGVSGGWASDTDLGLRSHLDPMSDVAEAARKVRTALFAAARSTPAKTVLITSAAPGEGKTIFAANLAISMAQAGNRTLLIDASFGHHGLQQTFDVRKASGLSNVLAGHITAEKAICRTPVERLELLPSGQTPPNSEILLNGSAFARLIEYVTGRYQCVILDAPSLQSCSDARILSASADMSLLVVRLGKTEAKAADSGLEQLLSVGARVLGCIVNDVQSRQNSGRNRGLAVGLQDEATGVIGRENSVRPQRVGRPVVQGAGHAMQRRRVITGLVVPKKEPDNIPEIDVLD